MDLFKGTSFEEDLLLAGFGKLVDFDPNLHEGSSSSFEDMLTCSSPLEKEPSQPMSWTDGSTCSSPYEDEVDGDAFGFSDFEDVFFPVEGEITRPDISNDITVTNFGLESRVQQQVKDEPFVLTRGDLNADNIETLKQLLLYQTGDILRSDKRQDFFVQKPTSIFSEQFKYHLSPFSGVTTCAVTNSSNNKDNNIYFRTMNQLQQEHQQPEKQIEQQQQQHLSAAKVDLKQENSDSWDESVEEGERSSIKASPTQQKVKRKKRKYERRASARKSIQLYQFMLKLLDSEDECVTWVSREDGVFKLLKSKNVAQRWGMYKKNDNMTYESLSRALRHYYAQEILTPVPKKLHYKFCQKTLDDWYRAKTC